MKVLLTGFEPFGLHETNVSWEVASVLGTRNISGTEIEVLRLPVSFSRAWDCLRKKLDDCSPDVLLMMGMATSRTTIGFERVAVNIDDAKGADNDGEKRVDMPIRRDGPAAYFSTLPIREMTDVLIQEGYPAVISNSAGTYVCNHLMYEALNWISMEKCDMKAGFVHLPMAKSNQEITHWSGAIALALEEMIEIK